MSLYQDVNINKSRLEYKERFDVIKIITFF